MSPTQTLPLTVDRQGVGRLNWPDVAVVRIDNPEIALEGLCTCRKANADEQMEALKYLISVHMGKTSSEFIGRAGFFLQRN